MTACHRPTTAWRLFWGTARPDRVTLSGGPLEGRPVARRRLGHAHRGARLVQGGALKCPCSPGKTPILHVATRPHTWPAKARMSDFASPVCRPVGAAPRPTGDHGRARAHGVRFSTSVDRTGAGKRYLADIRISRSEIAGPLQGWCTATCRRFERRPRPPIFITAVHNMRPVRACAGSACPGGTGESARHRARASWSRATSWPLPPAPRRCARRRQDHVPM